MGELVQSFAARANDRKTALAAIDALRAGGIHGIMPLKYLNVLCDEKAQLDCDPTDERKTLIECGLLRADGSLPSIVCSLMRERTDVLHIHSKDR